LLGGIGTPEIIVLGILLVVGGVSAVAGLVAWLWNRTMPELFGLPAIRFWQAFRLVILLNLLVSGSILGFNFALGS